MAKGILIMVFFLCTGNGFAQEKDSIKIDHDPYGGWQTDEYHAITCKNSRGYDIWGIANNDNSVVVDCKYYDMEGWKGNLIVRDTNGLYGIIAKNGSKILACKYDKISKYYPRSVVKGDKYGLISAEGKLVTRVKYDFITDAGNTDLILAHKGGKAGLLNYKGKVKIPFKFDAFGYFNEGGYAVAGRNKKLGFINEKGKFIIQPQYKEAHNFSRGKNPIAMVSKDGEKFGFINPKGEVVIPFKYDNPRRFSDEVVFQGNSMFISKEGKKIILRRDGSEIPIEADSITYLSSRQKIQVLQLQLGNKYGVINSNGRVLVPTICELTPKRIGMWSGFADSTLYVLRRKFEVFTYKYDGFKTRGEKHSQYVKRDATPQLYIESDDEDDLFFKLKCRCNGVYYYGIEDGDYNTLVDCIYDYVAKFDNHLVLVRYNEFTGLIKPKGDIIIPIEYDKIKSIWAKQKQFIIATKGNQQMVYSKNGEPLTPLCEVVEIQDSGIKWIGTNEGVTYTISTDGELSKKEGN